jgi:hypothetical protein
MERTTAMIERQPFTGEEHRAPGDNAAAVGFRLGEATMRGELSRRIKIAGTGDELPNSVAA